MNRYPYTYAADSVRNIGPHDESARFRVPLLSRSDAAIIRNHFARVLKIPDEELAKKLADDWELQCES